MVSKKIRSGSLLWVSLGLCLCLLSALGDIPASDAVLVWSDNIDDGTYAPEWTAIEGTVQVLQNRLWSFMGAYCWISHASTVAEGEWRFDLLVSTGDIRVSFIALDTDMFGADHYRPNNGYCIQFSASEGGVRLFRYSDATATMVDWYSDSNIQNQEQQVIVTRDSAGVFNVFANGEHKFQAQATQHSTSLYFLVLLNYGYIDNIEVYDEILTHPPDGGNGNGTTPPPQIPGFPALAIVVGLVSASTISVLYRRRQKLGPTRTK